MSDRVTRSLTASLLLVSAVSLSSLKSAPASALAQAGQAATARTFTNPLLPAGADPSVVYSDGLYHLVQSEEMGITVRSSPSLTGLKQARRKTVFAPGSQGSPCCEWWAPEILTLDGKWYIYVAADDGRNENHRMYVLESSTANGQYTFKGKIAPTTDRWAIDGTVLSTGDGERYFVWSGWEGDKNVQQDLYIARMANPWTIEGDRVMISRPTEEWEKRGGNGVTLPFINEGPEVLRSGDRTYLAYSASGSWSNDYCLGLLTLTGSDPMKRESWTKSKGCVFSTNEQGTWAPGHNVFTTSPDYSEVWHLYHANEIKGSSWGGRSIRAQEVAVSADGAPDFGKPAPSGAALPLPSGEYEAEDARAVGAEVVRRDFASGGEAVTSIDPKDTVTFEKVFAPKGGQYVLRAHYANPGKAGAHALKVNGAPAGTVSYQATGSAENYGTARATITLRAGENTLAFIGQLGGSQLDSVTVSPR